MRLSVLLEDIGLKIKPFANKIVVTSIIMPTLYTAFGGFGILSSENSLPSSLEFKYGDYGTFITARDYFGSDVYVNSSLFKEIKDGSSGDEFSLEVTLVNGNELTLTFREKKLKDDFFSTIK